MKRTLRIKALFRSTNAVRGRFRRLQRIESGTLEMQQIGKLIGGKGDILVMEGQVSHQAAVKRIADIRKA